MKKINNRKYDLFTIIIVSAVLLVLAISGLIFTNFTNDLGKDLQETAMDMDINQTYVNQSTDFIVNDLPQFTDNYIFWFFLATFVGLIIAALYLEFEPAIMIILLIFGSIGVLSAWFGSQVYGEFASDTNLVATSAQMTKTELLLSNPYFPVFIFIGLVIMLIVMYNKKRQGEYQ